MSRREVTLRRQAEEGPVHREPDETEEAPQRSSRPGNVRTTKCKSSPRSRFQGEHRWRVGPYKRASASPRTPTSPFTPKTASTPDSLPFQVGNGASDPFSASAFPINYFHQQLLPVVKRGYIYEYLQYVFPDHPNPGMQWVQNLCANEGTLHALHLFAYGLKSRLPNGRIPEEAHARAHQAQALATLRSGLERSEFGQSLADINTLLAAYGFYTGNVDEWKVHTRASNNITHKIGGLSKLNPLYRAVHLLAGPIVHGRSLANPSFPSSDFEKMAPRDDPVLKHYEFDVRPSGSPVDHPDIKSLFEQHNHYHVIYQMYRTQFGFMPRHPVQKWLDIRFHILKLINLETYLKVYRPPHDTAEDQRAANQINGMLILALSYGHQFIYHHTRTPSGLLGETPVTIPLGTIPFMHLKRHLQMVLGFSRQDSMKYFAPILWAMFILACHEHVDLIRTKESRGLEMNWAASEFRRMLQRSPPEQRSIGWMKSVFNEYLYDDVLDSFMVGMYL